MLRLVVILSLLASPALGDARSSSKWLKAEKVPPSLSYPAGCGDGDATREMLASKYNESRMVVGMTSTGLVLEVWASKEGTWTVLMARPDGVVCAMSVGTDLTVFGENRPPGL